MADVDVGMWAPGRPRSAWKHEPNNMCRHRFWGPPRRTKTTTRTKTKMERSPRWRPRPSPAPPPLASIWVTMWNVWKVTATFPCSKLSAVLDASPFYTPWNRYYRKRGSASYIVREVRLVREREREREREIQRDRDGSDVTIVVLKLAMSLHFPLPKICAWRWVYTFPCRKFAPFKSPFTLPISPFLIGHHCGVEMRNEFSLSVAKKCRTLVPTLSSGAIVFPSKKWIKLIPKTIGNRKRDCAWGCASENSEGNYKGYQGVQQFK